MPYEGLGLRHTATCTKECVHGDIVTEDGFVGSAFKVDQPDRFVRPADYPTIAVDDEFEIQLGGVHEADVAGTLAAVDVGDQIWIDPADNSLEVAAAAGRIPVGTVTEIDGSRTPDVARINANAAGLAPFLVT